MWEREGGEGAVEEIKREVRCKGKEGRKEGKDGRREEAEKKDKTREINNEFGLCTSHLFQTGSWIVWA